MGAARLGSSSLTERYSRSLREVLGQAAPNSAGPAKMRKAGPVSLSLSTGRKTAESLISGVWTTPVYEPSAFFWNVPMMAMVDLLSRLGRADRGLDGDPEPRGGRGGRRQPRSVSE